MAEVDAETRDMNVELNDSMKQSNQVTVHGATGVTEVGVRSNHNSSVDGDGNHGRCCSCCKLFKACCKPCMTDHNPLPDNPTRFDIIDFLSMVVLFICYCNIMHCCTDAVRVTTIGHIELQYYKWVWQRLTVHCGTSVTVKVFVMYTLYLRVYISIRMREIVLYFTVFWMLMCFNPMSLCSCDICFILVSIWLSQTSIVSEWLTRGS